MKAAIRVISYHDKTVSIENLSTLKKSKVTYYVLDQLIKNKQVV